MHYVKNFKGFAEAELDITKPFTLLIGQNGAGKSNLIEAIELLAFIAHGGLLHEISDIGRGGRLEIRGGLPGCTRHQQNSFTLGFKVPVSPQNPNGGDYRVVVQTTPSPRIIQESLSRWFHDTDEQKSVSLFKTKDSQSATANDIVVEVKNFSPGRDPTVTVPSNCSVLSRYEKLTENFKPNDNFELNLEVIKKVRTFLSSSFVLDPIPKLMRGNESIGNHQLVKNGANLSSVLYALEQGDEEQKAALARILENIKQLPNEPYHQFKFVTNLLNQVIFGMETGRDKLLTGAHLLSDGTLRCLAVLTALETVEPGSRLIIEEFDNGLHPSRIGMLVNAIAEGCQRRRLNVLVTTHNPATLNVLTRTQLEGVILCAWDNVTGATKPVKLLQLPRYEELLERGHLGDLVTRQVIDQYLLPNVEQQHQENMQKWLTKLKQQQELLS